MASLSPWPLYAAAGGRPVPEAMRERMRTLNAAATAIESALSTTKEGGR